MVSIQLKILLRENRLNIFLLFLALFEVVNMVESKYFHYKVITATFDSYRSDTKWKTKPYYQLHLAEHFSGRFFNDFSIYRPIDALHVLKFNGFGNNLFGILNALSIAQDLNITDIYINSTEFWWIDLEQKLDRFRFLEAPPSRNLNVIRDDFFRNFEGYPLRRTKYQYMFVPHIKKRLPKIDLSNETLIIHIRSGDIYSYNFSPNYAQPPLCYYKAILNKYKWKKVMILAEDEQNPVIPELIKLGAEFHSFDLIKTIQYIFYAKSLVIGFGTFGFGVLRVCDQPKVVYEFGERNQWDFGYQDNGIEFNQTMKIFINPRTEEYNSKMHPWKRSKEQIKLQLTSKCDTRWYQVTEGSLVPWGIK